MRADTAVAQQLGITDARIAGFIDPAPYLWTGECEECHRAPAYLVDHVTSCGDTTGGGYCAEHAHELATHLLGLDWLAEVVITIPALTDQIAA